MIPKICRRKKLIMLDERFDKYEDVLMVDLDMFVVKNVKDNAFDVPGVGLNPKVKKHFLTVC